MTALFESYSVCASIARNSGSNFFRSFALLGRTRRDAMTALYAFARLADDATDDVSCDGGSAWSSAAWHEWIDQLLEPCAPVKLNTPLCLKTIRLALADAVIRFSIPLNSLHDIVRGVNMDVVGEIRFDEWEQSKSYCHRVASSVGVACLSIWAKSIGEPPNPRTLRAALDCGVAFQLTNILRDVVEDAGRGRIYLPLSELERFDIDSERWLQMKPQPSIFALNELGDWRGLIRLQIERAKAYYESGWQVASDISLDGQRMFSLMWHTYRQLLDCIEVEPEGIWQKRVRVSRFDKLVLAGQHAFTPCFQNVFAKRPAVSKREHLQWDQDWPMDSPHVAVIGAGLAGINAAMHLARHGCRVTLLESKQRIGGRVGSFTDAISGQSVDYCQHVGMVCCTTLRQWIDDTDQQPYWTEQGELHFVSAQGKKIRVGAWPLPAPLHLCGLLLRWPQLSWGDRIRVGSGLLRLLRLRIDETLASKLAIDWLRENGQNDQCIKNFWATILVSALGEQVDRVTLGATHKVLVDGFAANRTAFHLLMPNRSLSELLEGCVATRLSDWGVSTLRGQTVKKIDRNNDGSHKLSMQGSDADADQTARKSFHAIVCAVPWDKILEISPDSTATIVAPASELQASPITGIHTWWDRPWLKQPHAILIDRLCQWIFPAPRSEAESTNPHTAEHYYQIVISGSRDLPRGDSDAILKAVKQDLAEILPESAVATMLRGRVVTDPNSVFSVSVGHESSRLASDALASERIWLAGDWTQTGWPATMEGSLRSGAMAAQGVLAHFGRPAKLEL